MKNSLETYRDEHDVKPSSRREAVKRGLALSVGGSALGLAGLVTSTSAQAWGPWHRSIVDWQVWDAMRRAPFGNEGKPELKKSKSDFWLSLFLPIKVSNPIVYKFSDYKGAYIDWRNSNDAMTKVGNISLMRLDEPSEYDYYLGDFRLYHKSTPYGKDISSIDIKVKNSTQNISVGSGELRRLDSADDGPFQGLIQNIFIKWRSTIAAGGRDFRMDLPLPYLTPNGFHSWSEYEFTNLQYDELPGTDINIVSSGIYMVRRFTFTMQATEMFNGNRIFNPVRFEIESHRAGGFNLNNWYSLQYVRIPDYLDGDYNRSSGINYEQTVQQVSGTASEFSRLATFSSDWNVANRQYGINLQSAMVIDASLIFMEAASALSLSYSGIPATPGVVAQTCSACSCLLGSAFATTRPLANFYAATIDFAVSSINALQNVFRILQNSSATSRRTNDISITNIYYQVATSPRRS